MAPEINLKGTIVKYLRDEWNTEEEGSLKKIRYEIVSNLVPSILTLTKTGKALPFQDVEEYINILAENPDSDKSKTAKAYIIGLARDTILDLKGSFYLDWHSRGCGHIYEIKMLKELAKIIYVNENLIERSGRIIFWTGDNTVKLECSNKDVEVTFKAPKEGSKEVRIEGGSLGITNIESVFESFPEPRTIDASIDKTGLTPILSDDDVKSLVKLGQGKDEILEGLVVKARESIARQVSSMDAKSMREIAEKSLKYKMVFNGGNYDGSLSYGCLNLKKYFEQVENVLGKLGI
jgi:hypothetical protein